MGYGDFKRKCGRCGWRVSSGDWHWTKVEAERHFRFCTGEAPSKPPPLRAEASLLLAIHNELCEISAQLGEIAAHLTGRGPASEEALRKLGAELAGTEGD